MLFRTRYGAGWSNFARAFHPSLLYSMTLDGWEFIGFDSGPSEFSARVLTRSQGRYGQEGDPVTRSVTREWLEATHARANVPIMGVHTLRHTFCSHLAMAGQPVTAIRDLAGHSSVAITNDYMHLAPAATVSAIDVLAAFHEKAARATSKLETGDRKSTRLNSSHQI